ncbi:ATP-dependent Zn protease [Hoeflea alexandrii]|uniref:ATP-dependent Zn protease n=1 Tax=Hoeflea alexandrii TaxID=288436 RepID=UPI0035D0EB91
MYESHLSAANPDWKPALLPLALAAAGKTGADIERLIREARQKARREKRPLTYSDIHSALTAGQSAMSPALIWRIAIHEAGHALAWTTYDIATVLTVTVGDGSGGFVESDMRTDVIQTEEWLNKMIACALAGRAAEKLIFGDCVLGSGGDEMSDLARATRLATDAEANLGFGQAQQLLYRSVDAQPSILSLDRQLAQQVHNRLEAAETMATKLLSQHRSALLALATRLAEAKTLDGGEVRSLLAREMNSVTPGSKGPAP